MSVDTSRLRGGELIAAAAAVSLLVLLLVSPWFGLSGRLGRTASELGVPVTINGWHGLPTLRWLLLITIIAAVALAYFQAARSAPALPASLSMIVLVLSVLSTVGIIYRVLISVPGPDSLGEARWGAFLGLVAALVLNYGAFRSLREEDPPDPERNAAIPVLELTDSR
jgi:hypothetical protein